MFSKFMQQLMRRDLRYGTLAEIGAQQFDEPAHLFQRRLRQPLSRFLPDQLLGRAAEAVAGGITRRARLGQYDLRAGPQCQFALHAIHSVFEAPQLAAFWVDQ
jgi:hypothetical protein